VSEEREAGVLVVPPDYLPWHAMARARLATATSAARMPHALLLHGPDGVGKERFASALAAGLFCRQPGPDLLPCGNCAECALSRAGTHPDLHWLRRPDDRKSIGVDAVRDTCEQLGMTSLRGGHRVAVVATAQLMTHSAQNAFLKTLEEPAPRTLLMLITPRPSALLATLRSRCQRVEIPRPPAEEALEWLRRELGSTPPAGLLELAGGAPMRALALAPYYAELEEQMASLFAHLASGRTEVTRAASDLLGEGLGTRLDWIEHWLAGSVRERLTKDATQFRIPSSPKLQRAAGALNMQAAFRIVDRLRESRRLLETTAAPQLVVEALLIELSAAFRNEGVA
jgi:DNA polymerase-3 subunit delta'